MVQLEGTVTRILQLDIASLTGQQVQEAVETLCDRLFSDTADGPSTHQKLLAFARLFGTGDHEADVADVMSRVLVELFPAGRVKARNSGQLEGLLRTAIRNRMIDSSRRSSRQDALTEDVADRRCGDSEAAEEAVFAAFRASILEQQSANVSRQRELQVIVDHLYESRGASPLNRRRQLLDQLGVSTATFYRRRSELAVAFLEFLESDQRSPC